MNNLLTIETAKRNEAENNTNKNAIVTSSIINEKDKQIKKLNSKKDSKTDKTVDLIKINTGFKVAPQTVWVQYTGDYGGGGGGFDYDPESRNSFVRLVLTIVFVMLVLTAAFTVTVYMIEGLRRMFLAYSIFIVCGAGVVMIGLSYAVNCSACTRGPPCNFICLFLALCAMSMICAAVTARYNTQLILFALIATTVTVLFCVMLACSSFDFTRFLLYIIVIAVAFGVIALIVSITMLIMKIRIPVLMLVMLVIGTLINVAMLVMELQMILGGRSVELSESDYTLAAFLLYTSIVDMFIRFVQMCGLLDELLN